MTAHFDQSFVLEKKGEKKIKVVVVFSCQKEQVGWDLTTAYDLYQVLAQVKSLELGYKKKRNGILLPKLF